MSSSVFKEYDSSNADDGVGKVDNNVVVFINKNGSVSVDHSALQDLLVNDPTDTNTSVSVIRVSSPTPSLKEELDEQEELEREMLKSYTEENDDDEDDDNDDDADDVSDSHEEKATPKEEKAPHVSVTVENYFSPLEAKKLASDILSIAGITNPLQITADYEFQRYVIANDHCYTPLTSPSQRITNKTTTSATTTVKPEATTALTTKQNKQTTSKANNVNAQQRKSSDSMTAASDENESKNSDDDGEESGSDSSYFSPSETENDRDSDLDFSVNDRPSRVKKFNRSKGKNIKTPGRQNSKVNKKRQSIGGELDTNDEFTNSAHKKRPISKTPRKVHTNKSVTPSSAIFKVKPLVSTPKIGNASITQKTNAQVVVKLGTPQPNKVTVISKMNAPTKMVAKMEELASIKSPVDVNKSLTTSNVSITGPPVPALAPISDNIKQNQVQIKKDKKPPAHVEALYSDMTSLFSTPDIIKKVGSSDKQGGSNIPNTVTIVSSTPSTNTNKTYFITTAPTSLKNRSLVQQPPQQPQQQQQPQQHQQQHQQQPQQQQQQQQQQQLHQQPIQLPTQIAVRPLNTTTSTLTNLRSEQDKQLDLIDSIVQQQWKQTTMPTNSAMNDDIPNIVKMLEAPPAPIITIVNTLNKPTLQTINQPTNVMQSFTGAITNDTQLLDESDLLVGLTNPDEGLTEDLLQHVAKLVEDKNLQEVIDKQVLGVSKTATITTSTVGLSMSQPQPQQQNQPKITSVVKNVIPQQMVILNKSLQPPPIIMSATNSPSIATVATASPVNHGKEPIKIVRRDGRVVTLPPIEAPTTRAKRRALIQPVSTESSPSVIADATNIMPSPVQIKAVTDVKDKEIKNRRSSVYKKQPEVIKAKSTPVTPNASGIEDDDDYDDNDGSDGSGNSEDDPYRLWCICRQPHNNRFMICCDICEDWFHGKCVNITKAMGVEMEARGAEWVCPECVKNQSGPKKKPLKRKLNETPVVAVKKSAPNTPIALSCIVCKKPARQSSIYCSDDCIRKHATTTTTNANSNVIGTPKLDSSIESDKPKKIPIGKQSTPTQTPSTLPTKPGAKFDVVGNKNNRVDVFERSTRRCLTGNSAPTVENLKQWLQDHPTFEVVHPGSTQAQIIKAKKAQLKRIAKAMEAKEQEEKLFAINGPQKVQTTLKIGPSKKIVLVNPQKPSGTPTTPQTPTTPTTTRPPIGKIIKIPQQVSLKPGTPVGQIKTSITPKSQASSSKTPQQQPSTLPKSVNQQNRRKPAEQKTLDKMFSPTGQPEPIRVSIQRTLKEQLSLRMVEITDPNAPKLTADEIAKFAVDTEKEIFYLFSKDTGTKYRAKYRSLAFNIKDRKNETLFRKICDKSIEPKQLVRMSPEELASQELALWRENENKHQLEMIKKSELDLLACAKSYVLKTHKGEEVIESKATDRVSLDPSVSVEDVVSVLNNSTVSSSTTELLAQTLSPVKDTRIDSRFEKYLSGDSSIIGNISNNSSGIAGKSGNVIPGTVSDTKSSSSSKKKLKRSRSRSRERQSDIKRSSSSSKHKRKRSRDRRSRSRERSRENRTKDKDGERYRDTVKRDDRNKANVSRDKTKTAEKKEFEVKKISADNKPKELPSKPPKPIKKEDNVSLIDKILEAQSTIDRILHPEETKIESEEKPPKAIVAEQAFTVGTKLLNGENQDQEPSSTVTIPTPPDSVGNKDKDLRDEEESVWSGSIVMVDVATFQISITSVSGDCSKINKYLPDELDVVGRIRPDTVWDYISKIKKSFNKEILLLRFNCAADEDNEAYYTLYKYLSSRKRFGVIKTKSSIIKDFYLLPLAAHKSLPTVLQPISNTNFENRRPDLLLGVIVKNMVVPLKRPAQTMSSVPLSKVARLIDIPARVALLSEDERYTPPSSPNILNVGGGVPTKVLSKLGSTPNAYEQESVLEDGDEPYSPGGSDDDESNFSSLMPNNMRTPMASVPIQQKTLLEISSSQLEKAKIQREMDEINRQIEAQKMEIAGMLHSDNVPQIDEPYSPTSSLSAPSKSSIPTLANISIPSNLKEMLNTIKNATSAPAAEHSTSSITALSIDSDDEYTPAPLVPIKTSYIQQLTADYIPSKQSSSSLGHFNLNATSHIIDKEPSKLAQLTEEELLSMVPDDVADDIKSSINKKPSSTILSKYNIIEPPPPGLEDEYIP